MRAGAVDRTAPLTNGWRASFGGFDLDTTAFELRRAGRQVHLEPQAFDVLSHLVRHRDRVVPKEELLDAVWGDRFVSESALASRVKHVRQALGDDGRAQRYVRTVHGRGYRFAPETPVAMTGPGTLTTDGVPDDGPDDAGDRFGLPAERTALLGRRAAVAEVAASVQAHRLVTLLGIGGVGKTRLAVAVGHRSRDGFGDGVRFVDLESCGSVRAVETAIADAAGVVPSGELVRELRSRAILFVLDNAEHVRDELATTLDHLLDRTEAPRFLVASRAPLELPDERRVPVSPLQGGDPDTPAEQLLRNAGERFGRVPEVGDPDAMRRICALLDGLPLAIELAAAALRVLTPGDLAERLECGHLDLLRMHRHADDRHAALVPVLEASRDRLDPAERTLLARMATLPPPFTIADAEQVRGDLSPDAVAAALGHLVDLSMVIADAGRFRLLETVRLLTLGPRPDATVPPPARADARPDGHTALARRYLPHRGDSTCAAG